jgi:hypothetical protein
MSTKIKSLSNMVSSKEINNDDDKTCTSCIYKTFSPCKQTTIQICNHDKSMTMKNQNLMKQQCFLKKKNKEKYTEGSAAYKAI